MVGDRIFWGLVFPLGAQSVFVEGMSEGVAQCGLNGCEEESAIRWPRAEAGHLTAASCRKCCCHWASYLTSLCLYILLYKTGNTGVIGRIQLAN